jgi:hypothetical protein
MYKHAESLGFAVDFIYGCNYELLMSELYPQKHVNIVGWLACDDANRMFHYSPVRYVNKDFIKLGNACNKYGFEKLPRTDFLPLWTDYKHEHPVLTIRKA